jgi:hypothetical protein
MFGLLNALINRKRKQEPEITEPLPRCRWVIDLPLIGGKRFGPFRTKDEALDYRREYIIRTLKENSTVEELPF